jgi:hypothetical protein
MLPMWMPERKDPHNYVPLWMYPRNESSDKPMSVIEIISATTGHWVKKKVPPQLQDDFLYEMQRDHSKDSKVA